MRLLYIDIDTLRADHLGCYGYPRATSPNIDAIARDAVVFENVHASDTPCLPSRTALLTGRFGIHNGVVNHGGTDAEPVIGGADRQFWSALHLDSFPSRLQRAGLKTASISSFAHRHSAFHWHAGFDETINVGGYGLEQGDDVAALATDWLARQGRCDDWFLHVHMWDPHTPYRAPDYYGHPFADAPHPDWLTETVRATDWQRCGPHGAQECTGFEPAHAMRAAMFPRQPQQIPDMAGVRAMFDGYDTGIVVADTNVGRIVAMLETLGIADETAIMISSDHGETLGELGIYGDHQTADQHVSRVPMLLRWPGLGAGRREAFHYQIDVSATILELLGQPVPASWDGRSFAGTLAVGGDEGRDHLVVSQGAWTCQRGVRFDDWMMITTLHDGYHLFDDVMLFDLATDPHEQHDLAGERPDVVTRGLTLLEDWLAEMMSDAARGRDPLRNVVEEGGPYHVRGKLPSYLERLRVTGRSDKADQLAAKFADDLTRPVADPDLAAGAREMAMLMGQRALAQYRAK